MEGNELFEEMDPALDIGVGFHKRVRASLGKNEVELRVFDAYAETAEEGQFGNSVGGKMAINDVRRFNPSIADPFDVTLECIRCHWSSKQSNKFGEVLWRGIRASSPSSRTLTGTLNFSYCRGSLEMPVS
ncbi:DUF6994 family protein [Arthrobacter sp. CAL618]|uniref:DUF6994 family protein n=1 Tax=Arthrobacter sp. CAL618 TaxID=1055770 RepID=UPI00040E1E65